VLENEALAADPRFSRNTERVRHRAELDALVQDVVRRKTASALCALLDRVRIAYGRVSTMADLVRHRSATTASVETAAGPVEVLAPPVLVDGERPALGAVPRLGEHTEALRAEFGRARDMRR
jgi:crotonobetainyl-CoA:carnitine CoA-transferase CaiB-like acyl-CoA transferase